MVKTEIVIARYNENLDWLKSIPKTIKITIYNKGNENNINYPFIKLPNIGRESHTYLYHIIHNYNQLADQTIFCQGDSIFHSPGFIDLLKNRKQFQPIQPLSAFYWPDGVEPFYFSNPPKPVLEQTKNLWIKKSPIHVEYLDNNFVTRFPYLYYQDHFRKLIELTKKTYDVNNVLEFFVNRFLLKNVDLDDLIPVCYAGLFSVNKNVILDNSIDFYNNIMSNLIYDIRYRNNGDKLDMGLYLEKLWLVIFNYKKYNKNYLKLPIKDYPIFNKNPIIKNNQIKFKIFNVVCDYFFNIELDNQLYKLFVGNGKISLKNKNNQKFIHFNPRENKNIQNTIKDMTELIFDISLSNNIFVLKINNKQLIKYTFSFKVNKITKCTLIDISNNNKFIDLL